MGGSFGPCQFSIINITAFDHDNFDSVLDDGDAIMIYFSEPVDKGCGRYYNEGRCRDGKYLNKTEIDNLLQFSHVLGLNYGAVWLSSMKLQLVLLDTTGSKAEIGLMKIMIRPEAKGEGHRRGMRNVPPVCDPKEIESSPISGNWGLAPPFIVDFQARAGSDPYDSIYGNSDQIIIHVCAGGRGSRGEGGCEPTNRFNFQEGESLNKSTILRMFNFSQSLGQDFVGVWEDAFTFRINVTNALNASPPEVHKLTVSVLHDGDCMCDDALCTFYSCPESGLFLRDASNRSLFSMSKSRPIRGDWGRSPLTITEFVARPHAGDVSSVGKGFSAGDTIEITFSHDTNYGRGPPGCFEEYELWPGQLYPASLGGPCSDNSAIVSKTDLDGLFFFSQSLGANYEGMFTTRKHLVITIKDPVGASPPGIGIMFIRVRLEGNLRNYPSAGVPSEALSPLLEGFFGPSSVQITKILAFDPGEEDMIYNTGDKIVITFNQPTNQAGHSPAPVQINKDEIDAVFVFSHSLGADYVGTWPSPETFVIEISNATGASPPLIASPYSIIDNSPYDLPLADPNGFQVQWTETCQTAFCDPNGNLKWETFDTLEDSLPLYRLLLAGQADHTIFNTVDLPCTYERVPRGKISNILIMHNGLDIQADFWLYIKTSGKLRDIDNTEDFANFSTLSHTAMLEHASTNGISTVTHENVIVPLTGDFGPSFMQVTSLTISDADNQDVIYSNGDQIEIKFSHETNLASMKAGKTVGKDAVNSLIWCENADFEPGDTFWSECGSIIVSGASNSFSGTYSIQAQRHDGRPYYKQMSGGNYYIYSYCNKVRNMMGCPRWILGSVIGSISGVYFTDSGSDPSLASAGTWQQWNGVAWKPSSITVQCGSSSGSLAPDTLFDPFLESETFPNSCDALGGDYTGMWRDRRTFVITIANSSGLIGYYNSTLGELCSPLPRCAIISINAPRLGHFYIRIKPSAWLRNFPVSSGALGHAKSWYGGWGAVSPYLSGDYGIYTPEIVRVVASDPDGADHVYSDGDTITIHFGTPTNMANVVQCDSGAFLSEDVESSERYCCSKDVCDAPILLKEEISNIFSFSQLLGNNYTGRWLLKGTAFEIIIVNASGSSTEIDGEGPPYIGGFVVTPIISKGRFIRSADGKSLPSNQMSPVLEGSFGPEIIKVIAVIASDPDDSESSYDVGDAIIVRFSETTNKGELPDKMIPRQAIDNLLQFNLPLGSDYEGDWVTCNSLRIIILNSSQSPPPIPLANITVTVLPSGNLRNWPPAAAASTHSFTGMLEGSFGPEAIKVEKLVADDGGTGKGTFDVNDTVTLVLSERTDRGLLPEHVTFEQINSFVSFNQRLGSDYSGRWLESGVWTSPLGRGYMRDISFSRKLVITIHNTSGASPPTIDTLRATFLPTALIRNVPPVCKPASSTSPALSGDFGPTTISIVGISARGDVNCGPACDSVYGDGTIILIR
jgi:hypothetical protein